MLGPYSQLNELPSKAKLMAFSILAACCIASFQAGEYTKQRQMNKEQRIECKQKQRLWKGA